MVGTSSQSVPVAWPLSISLGTTGTIYDVTFSKATGYGGFHKWGVPNSWMVCNGKSPKKVDH